MIRDGLTFHESMEVHELLNFKTICMATSKLAQGVVFDQELKALLDKDVQQSMEDVRILESLLSKSKLQ